jgi:hypothetical protein
MPFWIGNAPRQETEMKAMILGFAAALVLAIGTHFVLGSMQVATAERFAAPVSVRL